MKAYADTKRSERQFAVGPETEFPLFLLSSLSMGKLHVIQGIHGKPSFLGPTSFHCLRNGRRISFGIVVSENR
jgi:hypothetical protein